MGLSYCVGGGHGHGRSRQIADMGGCFLDFFFLRRMSAGDGRENEIKVRVDKGKPSEAKERGRGITAGGR